MGKYKTLAENTLIFTICNFTSKILVFFMLPFYTIALSKEDFGVAELIMSTSMFLIPLLTLSMADGCMRFAIDKAYDNDKVFSIGFFVVSGGIILVACFLPLVRLFSITGEYMFFFFLFYVLQSYNILFGHFVRGIGKVRIVGISGVVMSFSAVILNILLLFVFKWGLRGYMISFIVAFAIADLILFFGAHLNHYIKFHFERKLAKEILSYSVPLVPNSLSWWFNDAANRYIIGYYCSVGDVGLYSASSRLPSIVNTFRSIFIQAWQLSTITEYDKKDSNGFFSNIYRAYHFFIIVLVSFCIVFSKLLSSFLLSNEFFEAWIFTPFLFLGVLFGALVAFYSPTYLAHKKTKRLLVSTIIGALIAVGGNFLLVPKIGVIGSAVMSAVSYFVIYIFLHIDSMKYIIYRTVYVRYYLSYAIIAIQTIAITFFNVSPLSVGPISCFVFLFLLNRKDVVLYIELINTIINNRKNGKKSQISNQG